jgi:hypothetical protein
MRKIRWYKKAATSHAQQERQTRLICSRKQLHQKFESERGRKGKKKEDARKSSSISHSIKRLKMGRPTSIQAFQRERSKKGEEQVEK